MALLARMPQPRIQRIIDRKAVTQDGMIVVAVLRRQAERDGQQPGALRREIEPGGIGAPHDGGEVAQYGSASRAKAARRVSKVQSSPSCSKAAPGRS